MFIRATDSRENLSLTCERISNRQNLSSTNNIPPVTLRASGKVSLKVKLSDFLELTLQRKLLKRTLSNSKENYERGVTQIDNLSEKILSEVKFSERSSALQNKQKTHKRILPFLTEYRPSVPNLKNILMAKWHLIKNQPVLREIFKDPPILSYRKGRTLKDILVRAKL